MSRRKRKPVKRLIIQSDSSEEDDDDDDFVPVTKKFIKSEKLSTNEKRLKRLVPFDDENTATQDNSTCSTATDNSLTEKDSPIKKDTDSSSFITDKKEPNPPLPKKQQKPLVTIPPNKDSKTNQSKPLPQPKPYWKPPGAANGKSSTCSSSSSLGPCVRVGLSRKANIKPLHSLK